MKKTVFMLIAILVCVEFSNAQAPLNKPDNIGSGNCLDFDGMNNYVGIGDFTDGLFDNSATKMTIEAWINPSDVASHRPIISKYDATNCSERVFYFAIIGTGKLRVFTGSGAGCSTHTFLTTNNQVLDVGNWYHVAATVDLPAQELKLYVNGIEQAGTLSGSTWPTVFKDIAQPLDIAILRNLNAPTLQYFAGKMDEVRLWNTVLTSAQIRDNMNKKLTGGETNLVGYWNMNEGENSAVDDLTSNENDGSLQ